MSPNSIRYRLTFWYAISLSVMLFLFAGGTYLFVRENLFNLIDQRLDAELNIIQQTLDKPLEEFRELEAHGFLHFFKVEQDYWPIYVSSGWDSADLNYAMKDSLMARRWVWRSKSEQYYHLKRIELTQNGYNYSLVVAQDTDLIHISLQRVLVTTLIAIPISLFAGLVGGYFMAGRSLAPIQHLTNRARAICAENLAERLTVHNDKDELGQLTHVLNDMFARLEMSFDQLRRFTQDAAHELRTPLAVLRSVGEVGIQQQRDVQSYREIIGSMLEEVDRMARMVDGLLTLARAESGRITVQRKPENISELTREVVDCLRVLAEEKQQALQIESSEPAMASVDRNILNLALMNLIANAIRFTPRHGKIVVRVLVYTEQVTIAVQDNGPGIAKEHQARLFERFYRVDHSRSQETGGTGLGLAIALWAVEANGGRIELESSPGIGSIFRLVFSKTM